MDERSREIVDYVRSLKEFTPEQLELIQELRSLNPYFDSSDYFLYFEEGVYIKQRVGEIKAQLGFPLNKEQIISFLECIYDASEDVITQGAYLELLQDQFPEASIIDLIYHTDLSLEDIKNRLT
jgi:hypothetical protein